MSQLTADQQRVKVVLKEWDTISEAWKTPMVYHPGGWEDTIPEYMKKEVIRQRIAKINNGGWKTATDAEVVCYLSTASFVGPFDWDWTNIFTYETSLLLPQIRDALPDTPKELSGYQTQLLNELKYKIRNSQIRNRKTKKEVPNMTNRKLVMEEHGDKTVVGVIQDNCDPVTRSFDGDLAEILQSGLPPEVKKQIEDLGIQLPVSPLLQLLQEAETKWVASPKNPAYKAPVTPKTTPKPKETTATTPEKTEDLPLLSGTGNKTEAAPAAEEQAQAQAEPTPTTQVMPEPVAEALEKVAEAQGGSRDEIEKAEEPTAEVTSAAPPTAAETTSVTEEEKLNPDDIKGRMVCDEQASAEAGTLVADIEPNTNFKEEPVATNEQISADVGTMQQDIETKPPVDETGTPTPTPTPSPEVKPSGGWEYWLKDGSGPFADIQGAMDAQGMDKENRPHHNRWSRLSGQLKDQIIQKPKP